MDNILLSPPIAFIILMIAGLFSSLLLSGIAFRSQKVTAGKTKPYACGEDITNHRVQPDYKQFFYFALYFTIMHVVALIVATAPSAGTKTSTLAILYIVCAIIGLFILFRR